MKSKIPPHAKKVFEGVLYTIYQWDQRLFDGSMAVFEAASQRDVVTVMPIIGNQLVVLDELQPNDVKRKSFPGGRVDPGENTEDAVRRELLEETGMTFEDIKLIHIEDLGRTPKMQWYAYRYIATNLKDQTEQNTDAGEKITVSKVNFEEAKKLAKDNVFMCPEIMEKVNSLEELLSYPGVVDED